MIGEASPWETGPLIESFVLASDVAPVERCYLPKTRDEFMGRDMPNEPYNAVDRYPGWPHNEELIARDRTSTQFSLETQAECSLALP